METTTILAIFMLIWFVPSTLLLTLIHNYIQKKAPAWQSILDLLLLDGLKVMLLQIFLSTIRLGIGIFSGQINTMVAQVILGTSTSVFSLILIMAELILILKAMMIFKPGVLGDQPDQKVIGLFRGTCAIMTSLRFALDFYLSANRSCCSLTLEFLTGIEMIS